MGNCDFACKLCGEFIWTKKFFGAQFQSTRLSFFTSKRHFAKNRISGNKTNQTSNSPMTNALPLLLVDAVVVVAAWILGGVFSGCNGWLGSARSVRVPPNLSWASVESITVRIHSRVGRRRRSMYIWKSCWKCSLRIGQIDFDLEHCGSAQVLIL